MAKGRALQARGHLTEALSLFQYLYTQYSTYLNDEKNNGLALGRLLQIMGGPGNVKAALDIYTRLRTRTAGGQMDTPCKDKDIELTLGRHLQIMGGPDNMKAAKDIFTRLRTQAAGGQP
ncbi:hypothetical protein, partial [Sansalvadorimonas verongulae]|uniref:hypothetical protein n=1 Tax=Sansalvadorimonas verongulae TaxID=2172824 RepID=UPI0012BB9B91